MIVGMYVHQHWPYNHPYAARTWTLEDWRGYAGGLKRLGYNAVMIWPMLETMPDPPTPSDRSCLEKIAAVIDLLHDELGMAAWLVLCPNIVPDDARAAQATFEARRFFHCDARVNPADAAAVQAMMARREKLLRPLARIDAVAIIDSDPGGWPGSANAQFIHLLGEHRKLFDRLRPGIELVYWMHIGWQAYCDFYATGRFRWGVETEHADMLRRLAAMNPEPWSIAAGDIGNAAARAAALGLDDRLISFSYGRIEAEPSFPMTNFGGDAAWSGGQQAAARGVMGNAQTHCVQLPNTFAFARGVAGQDIATADYAAFADQLICGQGTTIVEGWQALAGTDRHAMADQAGKIEALPEAALRSGPLAGLLLGAPRRFITDLAMQLRAKAAFRKLLAEGPAKAPLGQFAAAIKVWQQRHGYAGAWWWPELNETLRAIKSPPVETVLNGQFTLDAVPPPDWHGSGYDFVRKMMADTETYTPRLIAAMKEAGGH